MKIKKILFIILSLLLMTELVLAATIYDRPTSYWWTGHPSADTGWLWMKTVDGQVMGSKGTGNIYYVDSNVSNEGDGKSWTAAKNTLDEAINLCTASNGDVIYVAQGHTETMGAAADEVDVDITGVTIIGLGTGDLMPKFDYTSDVTGAFAVGADDITFVNIRWHANVTDVNEAVEVESGSTNIRFYDCLFDLETEGTDDFLECIDSVGGTADRLVVMGCKFDMGAGACNAAINTKDADYMQVAYNDFRGDYAVACIKNNTTASNHISIYNNSMTNGTIGGAAGLNTEPCIELLATTSGWIWSNKMACNVATPDASIVAADCWVAPDNVYTETEGGLPMPPMWITTDTASNKIGVDDSSNLGTTANVTSDADGSILERLEFLQAFPSTDSAQNVVGLNDASNLGVTTSVTADHDGSVLERTEAIFDGLDISYNSPRYLTVDANFLTGSTWETVASHEILTVTGAVRIKIIAECTETLTDGADGATIALGTATNTTGLIAATSAAGSGDANQIDAGEFWKDATPGDDGSALVTAAAGSAVVDFVVINGDDVGYTIGSEAMTDGTITFHVWWTPISSTGAVVAGAGGSL